MKRKREKVESINREVHRLEYILLRLDFDYCLLSLYEAISAGDNESRLTLLDELYDLQIEIDLLEDEHPEFKHLRISI